MKTFQILPTDERFLALTEEQLDLIHAHYILDNPDIKVNSPTAYDPDYDKEETQHERFHDPDFDEEWEKLGREVVDENPAGDEQTIFEEETLPPVSDKDVNIYKEDEWEEV